MGILARHFLTPPVPHVRICPPRPDTGGPWPIARIHRRVNSDWATWRIIVLRNQNRLDIDRRAGWKGANDLAGLRVNDPVIPIPIDYYSDDMTYFLAGCKFDRPASSR